MVGKHRKRKGFASVLGLALVGVLAFGVFMASAAQASPIWHLSGKTLAERGKTQEAVAAAGNSLSVEVPEWGVTVQCGLFRSSSGYVKGEAEGSMVMIAEKCVSNLKNCQVSAIGGMTLGLGLISGGSTGVIETLTPSYGSSLGVLAFSGASCPLNELEETLYTSSGSLGAAVSQGSNELQLAGLSSYSIHAAYGGNLVVIRLGGTTTQKAPELKLEAW